MPALSHRILVLVTLATLALPLAGCRDDVILAREDASVEDGGTDGGDGDGSVVDGGVADAGGDGGT